VVTEKKSSNFVAVTDIGAGTGGADCSPNKVIGGAICSPNFSVGLLFSNIFDDITYMAVIL